jgi:hypothetical protein
VLNNNQVQTWKAVEIPHALIPSDEELHPESQVVAVQSTVPSDRYQYRQG